MLSLNAITAVGSISIPLDLITHLWGVIQALHRAMLLEEQVHYSLFERMIVIKQIFKKSLNLEKVK